MTAGFSGEVAGFYSKYRRGYSPAVTDWIAEAFRLNSQGIAVDLGCGTDPESGERYAAALQAAGYTDVQDTVLVDYEEELDVEHVIGNLYSATPADRLPSPGLRPVFEERIRQALPDRSFTERVRVSILTGRVP